MICKFLRNVNKSKSVVNPLNVLETKILIFLFKNYRLLYENVQLQALQNRRTASCTLNEEGFLESTIADRSRISPKVVHYTLTRKRKKTVQWLEAYWTAGNNCSWKEIHNYNSKASQACFIAPDITQQNRAKIITNVKELLLSVGIADALQWRTIEMCPSTKRISKGKETSELDYRWVVSCAQCGQTSRGQEQLWYVPTCKIFCSMEHLSAVLNWGCRSIEQCLG